MLGEVAFDEIDERHPVRRFEKIWRRGLNENGVFARSCFNPALYSSIIPWIVILEAMTREGEEDYLYRLCGTGFTSLVGRELTGQYIGAVVKSEAGRIMKRELSQTIQFRVPKYSETKLPLKDREFIKVYRGAFPVSSDGVHIDQVFAVVARTDCVVDTRTDCVVDIR